MLQSFDTAPPLPILWPVRIVKVPLGPRSYDIKIASGLLARLGSECARLGLGNRCVIISDSNVAPYYARAAHHNLVDAGFSPALVTVPAGETAKSLKRVQFCYDQLAVQRLERKSFIVALGGGVVGDLAGFVAATYLRGIPFVQVPTTLLAQVDSSVGGKVGVNLKAGKNLVGAFYQPRLVLCDLETLVSLPKREYRAGLAEVIKYGIIYDAGLFRCLERDLPKLLDRDVKRLTLVVARCCEIKADVVRQDETESGCALSLISATASATRWRPFPITANIFMVRLSPSVRSPPPSSRYNCSGYHNETPNGSPTSSGALASPRPSG